MTLKRRKGLQSKGFAKKEKKPKPTIGQLQNSGLVRKASSLGKRKPSGEKAIFEEIWNEREHNCYVCGCTIAEPRAINFSHLLPKGMYPEFRLDKNNIVLLCADDHQRWTHYGKSLADSPKWFKYMTAYYTIWEKAWPKTKK